MWDYDHDTLPLCIIIARAQHPKEVCTIVKVQTYKHGIKSFKYQGIKILNDLKKMDIYQNTNSKCNFLKELKLDLLSSYLT